MDKVFDPGSWIYRYYINPIIYDTSYNPVDTVTWAIILGLCILGLVRLFRSLDIKMDERLVVYTLPYVLAGASSRVIEDAELVSAPWRYLLITPLIFFLVFLVTGSSLLLCRKILGDGFWSRLCLHWPDLDVAQPVGACQRGLCEPLGHSGGLSSGIPAYRGHSPSASALPLCDFWITD